MRAKLGVFARWYKYPSVEQCEWRLMRREHIVGFIEYLKTRPRDDDSNNVTGAKQKWDFARIETTFYAD